MNTMNRQQRRELFFKTRRENGKYRAILNQRYMKIKAHRNFGKKKED